MKRVCVWFLAVVLALGLTACGEKKEEGLASRVTVNGVELALGAEFTADMEKKLGETQEVVQAPSCHYDGTDNIYYYTGFTVYTYMEQEKSILYSVEITDAAISTPEGAKVGMTLDEVKAACGEGFEETVTGISYSLGEGMKLNFRAADNAVTLIEYYAE